MDHIYTDHIKFKASFSELWEKKIEGKNKKRRTKLQSGQLKNAELIKEKKTKT